MSGSEYREIRRSIGSQVYVASLLEVDRATICNREHDRGTIGKEAALALIMLSNKKSKLQSIKDKYND